MNLEQLRLIGKILLYLTSDRVCFCTPGKKLCVKNFSRFCTVQGCVHFSIIIFNNSPVFYFHVFMLSAVPPHHIIAIGAYAVGMDEINLFFDYTPLDGLDYISIQHLPSDYKEF